MDALINDIAMVLLGFALAWVPPWMDRRRRIASHWGAIRGEAMLCIEKARAYLNSGIMAPLYRFPTAAYENALPVLLQEGEVGEAQLQILVRFFSHAQDINRGLDHATAMVHAHDREQLQREYARLREKAKELVGDTEEWKHMSADLIALLNEKLRRTWLLR